MASIKVELTHSCKQSDFFHTKEDFSSYSTHSTTTSTPTHTSILYPVRGYSENRSIFAQGCGTYIGKILKSSEKILLEILSI
jgi:hypothetical protein